MPDLDERQQVEVQKRQRQSVNSKPLLWGTLLLLAVILLIWAPWEEDSSSPQNVPAVPEVEVQVESVTVADVPNTPPSEVDVYVDTGPAFVTLAGGEVTLSPENITYISKQIVDNVQIKPLLTGLTPQLTANTVDEVAKGFMISLVSGDPLNPDMQKNELYRFGGLLRDAANGGNPQAMDVRQQFINGYKDSLAIIGPHNASADEIVLAVVALDALGEPALAEQYALEVFAAREAAAQATLIYQLEQQGMDSSALPKSMPKGQEGTSPDNFSENAPGSAAQNSPEAQANKAPSGSDPTFEQPPDAFLTQNPEVPNAVPPVMVQPNRTATGLGIAPYNLVIMTQWAYAFINGNELNDSYVLQEVSVETITVPVIEKNFFYMYMRILRTRESGKEINFSLVVITATRYDFRPGDRLDYMNLSDLIEGTYRTLLEGNQTDGG